jgi:hypothetical protein
MILECSKNKQAQSAVVTTNTWRFQDSPRFLVVACSVASEFENLSGKVFENGSEVDCEDKKYKQTSEALNESKSN